MLSNLLDFKHSQINKNLLYSKGKHFFIANMIQKYQSKKAKRSIMFSATKDEKVFLK